MPTILITGGAGYIGSQCALSLMEKGYDIVIMDNVSTGNIKIVDSLKSIQSKGKIIAFEECSLLDADGVDRIFKKHKIGAVIHFAAFSQVAESMKDPAKYYRNNVSGTINLLDAMRCNGVGEIVFSSTAAVYGEPKYVPIDENHPKDPINPYGRSKLMIESIMDDYSAYGIRSVRLRYFNVAGADGGRRIGESHDPETHLIPNVLKRIIDGKEFSLYGDDYETRDGTCVRDYVNVEDLADAHVLALEYLENGGKTDCFNIGTDSGSTVKEILKECERVTGRKVDAKICPRREGDPASLVADNSKARKVLGWTPKRTLAQSIETAYEWEMKKNSE